ncbi:hypothetical protein NADE_000128 [Nannochloris sp. 'desiccata']|nr:hypothetical protein KSW81_005080 [Chlorella desiccata (nom. nud.)]KAH7617926.1 hypothetical protein NADE_000128 [Chlorella desiccata (nom. nud.)]
MWNQLSSLTNSIAQQATELAQEVGLDEQLDDDDYSDGEDEDYVDETALHTTMPTHRSPSRGYRNSSSGSRGGAEETEVLRQRLETVEAAAADALGELEDYKDKLQAAIASRDAARAQITKLKSAAGKTESSGGSVSQEDVEKLKNEVDSLKKDLEEAKAMQVATGKGKVKDDGEKEEGNAAEELQALKQKMSKAKRQFTAMKQQLAEAVSAKEAALEKLQTVQQEEQEQGGEENFNEEEEEVVAALKIENAELQERIKNIEEMLSSSEAQQNEVVTRIEEEAAVLARQLKAALDEKEAAEERVAAAESALVLVSEKGNEEAGSLEATDKNADKKSIEDEVKALRRSNQELEERFLQAENEVEKYKTTKSSIERELNALKAENSALAARVEEAETKAAATASSELQKEESLPTAPASAETEKVIEDLRAEVKQKCTELEALREGAKAESQLAAAAVKNAEQKVEDAVSDLEEMKAALTAAQEAHQEAVAARTAAFSSIETERIRASEAAAQAEQWQVEVQTLQRRYEEEKTRAAETLDSTTQKLQEEMESTIEEQVAKAVAAAVKEAEQTATAVVKKSQAEIEELQQRCQQLETALETAESSKISDAEGAEKVERLLQTVNELQSKADKAVEEAAVSKISLEDALKECESLKEAASERQKRFAAVQSSFESRKTEFMVQAEQLAAAVAAAESRSSHAEVVALEAKQLSEIAIADKNHAVEKLDSILKAKDAAEALVIEAQTAANQAAEKAAVIENKLAAAEETAAAEAVRSKELEVQHAEDLNKVAEKAKNATITLEHQLQEARSSLADVTARAESAEAAKIELSLKVAELAQERATGESDNFDALPSGEAEALPSTSTDEGFIERAKAAELAAAAATRRATAAEREIESLKVAVSEAEKKAKEMAWQVKMLASSSSSDGGGSSGKSNISSNGADGQIIVAGENRGRLQQLGGMLDMLGCAINYNRRGGGGGGTR